MATYTDTSSGGVLLAGASNTANFDPNLTGSIYIGGCATYNYVINLPHLYDVGDVVYSRKKALKGVLKRFAIKELRYGPGNYLCRICVPPPPANYPPLYVDTFNAFHNEEDLVSLAEAQELVDAYLITWAANYEEHTTQNC